MGSKLLSPPADVWDQAEVPCCVSMAVITAMEMMAAAPALRIMDNELISCGD